MKASWDALKFSFRNFPATFGLQVLLVLIPLAIIVLYWFVEGGIGMTSAGTIFLVFLVQQLTVASRIWARIWAYASQVTLFSGRQAAIMVEPFPVSVRREETTPVPLVEAVEKKIPKKRRPAGTSRARRTGKSRRARGRK